MKHVFVESNWVFQYCAPAHRSAPESVKLVELASRSILKVYVPAVSLREGSDAIRRKCQPTAQKEFQEFRRWAAAEGKLDSDTDKAARTFINIYNSSLLEELGKLDDKVDGIANLPGIEVFALNLQMLDRAIQLRAQVPTLKPFDEAILAAVLVRVAELRSQGEQEFVFCTLDGDLVPVDRKGNDRKELKGLYASAGIAVRRDFAVT